MVIVTRNTFLPGRLLVRQVGGACATSLTLLTFPLRATPGAERGKTRAI